MWISLCFLLIFFFPPPFSINPNVTLNLIISDTSILAFALDLVVISIIIDATLSFQCCSSLPLLWISTSSSSLRCCYISPLLWISLSLPSSPMILYLAFSLDLDIILIIANAALSHRHQRCYSVAPSVLYHPQLSL